MSGRQLDTHRPNCNLQASELDVPKSHKRANSKYAQPTCDENLGRARLDSGGFIAQRGHGVVDSNKGVVYPVQRELSRIGVYGDRINGSFGPKTEAAVKSFQRIYNEHFGLKPGDVDYLRANGVVDSATWQVLKSWDPKCLSGHRESSHDIKPLESLIRPDLVRLSHKPQVPRADTAHLVVVPKVPVTDVKRESQVVTPVTNAEPKQGPKQESGTPVSPSIQNPKVVKPSSVVDTQQAIQPKAAPEHIIEPPKPQSKPQPGGGILGGLQRGYESAIQLASDGIEKTANIFTSPKHTPDVSQPKVTIESSEPSTPLPKVVKPSPVVDTQQAVQPKAEPEHIIEPSKPQSTPQSGDGILGGLQRGYESAIQLASDGIEKTANRLTHPRLPYDASQPRLNTDIEKTEAIFDGVGKKIEVNIRSLYDTVSHSLDGLLSPPVRPRPEFLDDKWGWGEVRNIASHLPKGIETELCPLTEASNIDPKYLITPNGEDVFNGICNEDDVGFFTSTFQERMWEGRGGTGNRGDPFYAKSWGNEGTNTATGSIPREFLLGSYGCEVGRIQVNLNRIPGVVPVLPNGEVGPDTIWAVRHFNKWVEEVNKISLIHYDNKPRNVDEPDINLLEEVARDIEYFRSQGSESKTFVEAGKRARELIEAEKVAHPVVKLPPNRSGKPNPWWWSLLPYPVTGDLE